MTRGKHKRKKRNADQQALESGPSAAVTTKEEVSQEGPSAENEDRSHPRQKGSAMWRHRVWDWVKRNSSFTDWCIAAFTLVLALVAIYQYEVMGGQLKVMRNDQRAWLVQQDVRDTGTDAPEDHSAADSIIGGNPVRFRLHVINGGKTPASKITVHIFILILPASEEPPLDWVDHISEHPHQELQSGMLFPGMTINPFVARVNNGGNPVVATEDEAAAVRDGRAYVIAFGTIAYDDVFNESHITKFCGWDAEKPGFETAQFNVKKCAQFNEGD